MLATTTIALLASVSLGNTTTSMNNTMVVVLPKEAKALM
jgi:hypothetical protein